MYTQIHRVSDREREREDSPCDSGADTERSTQAHRPLYSGQAGRHTHTLRPATTATRTHTHTHPVNRQAARHHAGFGGTEGDHVVTSLG